VKQAADSSVLTEATIEPRRDAISHGIVWVLATSLVTLYLGLFLRVCWRIGDEGSIVYGAQRVLEGAIPSRDFFEVMGPGAFYWLALWFKLLGTSWLTSRLAILATALCSAWAIHYATTRLIRGKFVVVPALVYTVCTVPLWPGASHHLDSNMWVLLAFAVLVRASRFDTWSGFAAGILLGIASTIMPQKGILTMFAFAAAVILERAVNRRRSPVLSGVAGMVGGFTLVGAAVVLFFWLNGALYDLVYANAIWPASQYHSVNAMSYGYGVREWFFPQFASILAVLLPVLLARVAVAAALFPLVFLAALPLLIPVSVGFQLGGTSRFRKNAEHVPWAYWLGGTALLISECHRPDIFHIIFGSPILLIVGVSWLGRVDSPWGRRLLRLLVTCVLVLAALLGLIASAARTSVQTRRGTVAMLKSDDALQFLQDNVPAGGNVFVYPYYPMYYFLADVRNPTRFSLVMYHMNTREQFQEIIQALESAQVEFVLWDTTVAGEKLTQWFPGYTPPPADEQLLEAYLESKYKLVSIKNGFRVLQRKTHAVPSAWITALPDESPALVELH
jgi:hypothetical protein